MQQPTADELLERQAHRLPLRLTAWALGPLLIPKDPLLPSSHEKTPLSDGPAAQVPRYRDQPPLPLGITRAAVHVPLGAAQLVQHVVHLLEALPLRDSELPLVQPRPDGGQALAPQDRHDHSHRQ